MLLCWDAVNDPSVRSRQQAAKTSWRPERLQNETGCMETGDMGLEGEQPHLWMKKSHPCYVTCSSIFRMTFNDEPVVYGQARFLQLDMVIE